MFERAGLARFGEDLLGGDDRLLLFALGDNAGAGPRFVDHFLRVGVGFGKNFLLPCLALRELLLDLLGVEQTFGDPLPALFEHSEDRLVGKLSQEQRHDDEADDLREEDFDIETKLLRGVGDQVGGDEDGNVHLEKAGGGEPSARSLTSYLTRNKA